MQVLETGQNIDTRNNVVKQDFSFLKRMIMPPDSSSLMTLLLFRLLSSRVSHLSPTLLPKNMSAKERKKKY